MKTINRENQVRNASAKECRPARGTKSCQLISTAYQIFGIGMLSAHAQDPLADSLQDSSSRDASLGQSPPILLAQNIPMSTGIQCVKWHGARPSPSYNFSQPSVFDVEPSEPSPPSANELIGRDWANKGGQFEKKGDYANAYQCYKEAVRYGYMVQYLGPLRDHAHAMALYKQGDLENALTVAIKLVQTAIRENQVNRAYEVDYATIGYALGNRGADQCYAKGDYAAQAEAYKWAVWFAKKGVQSSDNAGKAAWQMNVILAEAKLAGAKARMYEKAGNLKKAIDWQQRSLLNAREIQASGRDPDGLTLKRSQDLERLKGQLAQSSGGNTHRDFFGTGSVPPEKAGLKKPTAYTPSRQSETRAADQLVLSNQLGQNAVQAALTGNLEQARELAELSSQAMSRSLSKSELAKIHIPVPQGVAAAAAPANVQLQKEMIQKIRQQIAALGKNPSSGGTAALRQLNSLYDQIRNQPASASDYLLKLQTRQLSADPLPAGQSQTTARTKPTAANLNPREVELEQKLKKCREELYRLQADQQMLVRSFDGIIDDFSAIESNLKKIIQDNKDKLAESFTSFAATAIGNINEQWKKLVAIRDIINTVDSYSTISDKDSLWELSKKATDYMAGVSQFFENTSWAIKGIEAGADIWKEVRIWKKEIPELDIKCRALVLDMENYRLRQQALMKEIEALRNRLHEVGGKPLAEIPATPLKPSGMVGYVPKPINYPTEESLNRARKGAKPAMKKK